MRVLGSGGGGGFTEADSFELGCDEAARDDGQVRDDEEDGSAGGCAFERDVEETVERRSEKCDLGEPSEDGELEE